MKVVPAIAAVRVVPDIAAVGVAPEIAAVGIVPEVVAVRVRAAGEAWVLLNAPHLALRRMAYVHPHRHVSHQQSKLDLTHTKVIGSHFGLVEVKLIGSDLGFG